MNLTLIRNLSLLLAFAGPGVCCAASTFGDGFHQRVVSTYNFEPRTLSPDELKEKSNQLDAFWSSVTSNQGEGIPLLREELSDSSNSAFFFYDGAKLLLSLSKERSDKTLALNAVSKTDLRSIQSSDYLALVHWFAADGFDTREAAFKILSFPDFKAFIPQHALTLGQNYSLIYMLYPLKESVFVDDLIGLLATETNEVTQATLILGLWYSVTPAGNAALKRFAEDQRSSVKAKQYIRDLLSRNPSASKFNMDDPIRDKRRDVMRRPISDEALLEFDKLTAKLLAK